MHGRGATFSHVMASAGDRFVKLVKRLTSSRLGSAIAISLYFLDVTSQNSLLFFLEAWQILNRT